MSRYYTMRVGISLAMLPLILLSGMPLAICVCASGEQRLFCRGISAAALPSAQAESPACCRQPALASSQSLRSSCCATRAVSPTEVSGTSISSRCCQSVTTVPSPTIATERVTLPDEQPLVGILPTRLMVPGRVTTKAGNLASPGDVPPLDLVILHRVLTI